MLAVTLLAFSDTNLRAQQYTVLHTFAGWPSDGDVPVGRLLLSGSTLFGTTFGGSTNTPDLNGGIVFSLNTDGTGYTILHSFRPGPDGQSPNGGLALSGNTLYGVAETGGQPDGWGTVFSITTNGSNFNIVHNFSSADGSFPDGLGDSVNDNNPSSSLLLSGNALYGVTGNAILYSVNTDGTGFLMQAPPYLPNPPHPPIWGTRNDGAGENDFELVLSDNTLYGVTELQGEYNAGTIVSFNGITSQYLWAFSPEINNNWPSGARPSGRLVINGNTLYGTTTIGGAYGAGTIFSIQTDGSGFTTIYNFTGGNDGANSAEGLILAGDTLYGVASGGGRYGGGTVFSISTNGAGFTVLYSFTGGADGGVPWGGPILSGCILYGTTTDTGGSSLGTVFSLAIVPGISSWNLTVTNVVLNMTNGVANCAYTMLTSTNLTSPPSQWTSIATNTLALAGNFTFTITNGFNPTDSQRYYTVRSQ
ncbi:MAG: choice-of-anchor tandem repeat GloVer-containing protein [Limisphaerales bacterium]